MLVVRDEGDVVARCGALTDELRAAGVRVQLDARADVSMGRRATDWELKGIPVRLEVGPRDLADGVATLVRRITAGEGARSRFRSTASSPRSSTSSTVSRPRCSPKRRNGGVAHRRRHHARRRARGRGHRLGPHPWDTVGADGEAELAQASVSVRCLHRADGSLPESDDERGLIAVVAVRTDAR